MQRRWRSVLHEGRDPIKESEKQKHEAMRTLHSLKDIAVGSFESCKAELKDDDKSGDWFSSLQFHVLPK